MRKDNQYGRIGVLAGGLSAEREISLLSGREVFEALTRQGYDVLLVDVGGDMEALSRQLAETGITVAFLALHGRFGEDGTVQRLLELRGVPYTGSGPEASRLALDKIASKRIFADSGIPVPPYRIAAKGVPFDAGGLSFPAVVKPQREGSSIGLSVVREPSGLDEALSRAFSYDDEALVETFILGSELTVGILDDEPLPVIQIVSASGQYDYEAKYVRPDTRYLVPAPIPALLARTAQDRALQVHRLIGCRSFSRIDMIAGGTGEVFVLELNTIPGLTPRSLLPKAAAAAGISFDELCVRLLRGALR